VQQALNNAGYNVGPVNGVWNQQTAQTAQSFQRARGLEPTGTLTAELLSTVGASNWLNNSGAQQAGGGPQGYGQSSGGGDQGGFGQSGGANQGGFQSERR
jgi:peptidoglycan hydrolase-like protein with peptidoglycan-binding domain